VFVEDGDGAGVERDGAFAVVALGVPLPDDDTVGDGHGLTDRESCPVELEVAPSQRERFGTSQAGGGDEEPQGVVPVVALAAVVEEGDELVAGPAVVAGVAGSGASGLGWVGEVGDVAGQEAAGDGGFECNVQAAVDVADALGAQALAEVGGAACDRAGPSVGAAWSAAFAIYLEAAVEPVEVFWGELLEADPLSAGTGRRLQTLDRLAASISVARRPSRVVRVAVDGVDGAGKTVFAEELADVLRRQGVVVLCASVDGFHNPAEIRRRRGRGSPEGFCLDSYDDSALRRLLLNPLANGGDRRVVRRVYDVHTEQPVPAVVEAADDVEVLVFDGISVHRSELRDEWDLSVLMEVEFGVSIPRGADRGYGDPDPAAASNHRYVQGQRHYFATCQPRHHATWVVDNNDLADAHIVETTNTWSRHLRTCRWDPPNVSSVAMGAAGDRNTRALPTRSDCRLRPRDIMRYRQRRSHA